MKELTIEQRAQRYDEAIERARKELQTCGSQDCDAARQIFRFFPELKESEDERIRKEMIFYFTEEIPQCSIQEHADKMKEFIAFLEKQGEHAKFINNIQIGDQVTKNRDGMLVNLSQLKRVAKPAEKQGELIGDADTVDSNEDGLIAATISSKSTDKAEPKFKVGDWISGYYTNYKVTGINSKGYAVEDTDGNKMNILFDNEKFHHLWNIADAKDGDVLCWDESKCIALFKNIYDKESFNSYGFVGHCTDTFESRLSYHDIKGAHPATKEQRDLLFKKMKEAGYRWDKEKKELKKLTQSVTKKSDKVWSEEDEKMLDNVTVDVDYVGVLL